jgi:hypothetical protein
MHTESVKAWVGMSWVQTVGSLKKSLLGSNSNSYRIQCWVLKIFDDNKFAALLALSVDMRRKYILMKVGKK